MKILVDADGCPVVDIAIKAAKKIRNAGGRLRGSPKRNPEQDVAFAAALEKVIDKDGKK